MNPITDITLVIFKLPTTTIIHHRQFLSLSILLGFVNENPNFSIHAKPSILILHLSPLKTLISIYKTLDSTSHPHAQYYEYCRRSSSLRCWMRRSYCRQHVLDLVPIFRQTLSDGLIMVTSALRRWDIWRFLVIPFVPLSPKQVAVSYCKCPCYLFCICLCICLYI